VTALPPDPDPANTPAVERGGGVAPGETPPASAQTAASPNPDPKVGRRLTVGAIASFVAIALFVALFVATAILLILKMFGVFD
jgi:hypothetical protein